MTRNSIRLKKCCTNVATREDVGNRLTAGRKGFKLLNRGKREEGKVGLNNSNDF
jgi:hypothetical protein